MLRKFHIKSFLLILIISSVNILEANDTNHVLKKNRKIMTPFFSVVIPLFNKEHFIEKTIQSVLNQTLQDFEIIIINDGSTDASLEKVELINDDRISVFTTKNLGVSHARNYGIQKAKGHDIAFLDADDYWESEFLESIKGLIEKYPNVHSIGQLKGKGEEEIGIEMKGGTDEDVIKIFVH